MKIDDVKCPSCEKKGGVDLKFSCEYCEYEWWLTWGYDFTYHKPIKDQSDDRK